LISREGTPWRSKERQQYEPTTQAVRTLQVVDVLRVQQKLVAIQFAEVELVGDCRGSALSAK